MSLMLKLQRADSQFMGCLLLLITSKISLFHPTCSPRREAKSRLDKKREMRFFFIFLLQERVRESVLVFKLLSIIQAILDSLDRVGVMYS